MPNNEISFTDVNFLKEAVEDNNVKKVAKFLGKAKISSIVQAITSALENKYSAQALSENVKQWNYDKWKEEYEKDCLNLVYRVLCFTSYVLLCVENIHDSKKIDSKKVIEDFFKTVIPFILEQQVPGLEGGNSFISDLSSLTTIFIGKYAVVSSMSSSDLERNMKKVIIKGEKETVSFTKKLIPTIDSLMLKTDLMFRDIDHELDDAYKIVKKNISESRGGKFLKNVKSKFMSGLGNLSESADRRFGSLLNKKRKK